MGSSGVGRITASNPRAGFVGDPDNGYFAHPTIVAGLEPGDDLYSTETFGPLVSVGKFSTIDEAIALSNGHGYGLSSAIYSSDPKSIWTFREGVSDRSNSAYPPLKWWQCCHEKIRSKGFLLPFAYVATGFRF